MASRQLRNEGKELVRLDVFDNTEPGRARFGEYLAQAPIVPSYLLVDVVEEDFQRDVRLTIDGATMAGLPSPLIPGSIEFDVPAAPAAPSARETRVVVFAARSRT